MPQLIQRTTNDTKAILEINDENLLSLIKERLADSDYYMVFNRDTTGGAEYIIRETGKEETVKEKDAGAGSGAINIGDMVRIKNDGQIGVVSKVERDHCNVVRKYANRIWAGGYDKNQIEPLHYQIEDLIDTYASWLSDACWVNTDHSEFDDFMKKLKKIRKKYRKIVKRRMNKTH